MRRKLTSDNCLAVVNPDLMKQWHPTKNSALNPFKISPFSHKKAYWICSKNKEHEWEAAIKERHYGHGCPYCSHHKVSDQNRLSLKRPELIKEWHPTKNNKLTPYDVSYSSAKIINWICNRKHEWKVSIHSRTSQNSGCPYCSNNKVCIDNCLATKRPDLIKEWHPTKNGKLTPWNILSQANKKFWWVCPDKGHEYQSTPNARNNKDDKRKNGCPYCSNNKVCIDNCLATLRPDLIKEWHSTKNGKLTPYNVLSQSNKKRWWVCEKNHVWQASPNSRNNKNDKKKHNCPYCSGHKVCIDNCLATLNPRLANEWHSTKNNKLTPYDVTCGCKIKVWWKCKNCNHIWNAEICSRNIGNGCPACSRIFLKDGIICDSLLEAYFYLKYKKENPNFIHHGLYGKEMGKRVYDFYFPKTNTYVEVTSFFTGYRYFNDYIKNIKKKKKYVEKILKANFIFIQHHLTRNQLKIVMNNRV